MQVPNNTIQIQVHSALFSCFTTAGGKGQQGAIVSVGSDSDGESWLSWVKVKWDKGGTNDYRRGHCGKVDVKYVKEADGEGYYIYHLPKLGKRC